MRKFVILSVLGIVGVVSVLSSYDNPKNDPLLAALENAYELENSPHTLAAPTSTEGEGVRVPIVVYHSVSRNYFKQTKRDREFFVEPQVFENQLQYLKDNDYTVITLEDLSDHLLKNTPLPPNPVVLTFDDGWENQYQEAFPVLKKYGYSGTFFVWTNAIGHKHFLTWAQIKEMDAAGMTIAAHTKSHPYLVKINNENKLRGEIAGSKKVLEENLGKKVNLFAYPFGHYNDKIIAVVKEAGFKSARSTYVGIHHTPQDIYTLKSVEAVDNISQFAEILKGQIK